MGALKIDPAVESFDRLREESYKTYRFTRRNVLSAVIGAVVFPMSIYYLSKATDRQYSWPAKLRSETLTQTTAQDTSDS